MKQIIEPSGGESGKSELSYFACLQSPCVCVIRSVAIAHRFITVECLLCINIHKCIMHNTVSNLFAFVPLTQFFTLVSGERLQQKKSFACFHVLTCKCRFASYGLTFPYIAWLARTLFKGLDLKNNVDVRSFFGDRREWGEETKGGQKVLFGNFDILNCR